MGNALISAFSILSTATHHLQASVAMIFGWIIKMNSDGFARIGWLLKRATLQNNGLAIMSMQYPPWTINQLSGVVVVLVGFSWPSNIVSTTHPASIYIM